MRRAVHGDVATALEEVRPWDGTPRPAAWRARLKREWQKGQPLTEPSGSLEAARRAGVRPREEPVLEQGRQWATRRGLGGNSAWLCGMALFAWRDVQTPKQGGA